MKQYLIILISLVITAKAFGQIINVSGTVVDNETVAPIGEVYIQINENIYQTKSDGSFKIAGLNELSAKISKTGYKTLIINLKEGYNQIRLRKEYISLSEVHVTTKRKTIGDIIAETIYRYSNNYESNSLLGVEQKTYLTAQNDTLLFSVDSFYAKRKKDKHLFYGVDDVKCNVLINKTDKDFFESYVGNVNDVLQTGLLSQLKKLMNDSSDYIRISSYNQDENQPYYDIVFIEKTPSMLTSAVTEALVYNHKKYSAAGYKYVRMINLHIDSKTYAVTLFDRYIINENDAIKYRISIGRNNVADWIAYRDSTAYLRYSASWVKYNSSKNYIPIVEEYYDNSVYPFYKGEIDNRKNLNYHFIRTYTTTNNSTQGLFEIDIVDRIKTETYKK